MSVQAISWSLKQRTGSPSAKAVLFTLANYADEDGTCFPGQERLALETDQSVDSVQRRLKELEALGLISRERRGGSGEGRSSDRYRLHLDQLVLDLKPGASKAAECGVAPGAKPQSAGLPKAARMGATPQIEDGNTAAVRLSTIDEPSVEPLDSHTPLPPQHRHGEGVGGSILDQVKIRHSDPEPAPVRWADLEELWPWEDGESRIQAEARFEALDRKARRHVLVAAPTYLRSRANSRRKRSHLKTFIEDRLYLDYPAEAAMPTPAPKQVFIAVGTQEFAAWDRAYREAGRPGMPKAARHGGRDGWWRPALFPPSGWSYEGEMAARRVRDGPGRAA